MSTKHMQPQCEDYTSGDSDTGGGAAINDSIPRKQSPSAQANVSTKRSKELNSEKAKEKMPANMDLRSDSGYSSYTAASKSSADSAPSTSRYPPPAPTTTAPQAPASPAPKTRKSAGAGERQHSNESSPRQKPSRTASVSSKRPAGTRRTTLTQGTEECRDPNWLTIGPNAEPPRRQRPEMPPSMSSHNVRNLNIPSDQVSHHSDPHPYSPPSPTYARHPAQYGAPGPAVVQQPHRTRRPSSATRTRPQSFAGEPGVPYWQSGMPVPGYPSPPQEQRAHQGPPPAFYNPHMQHMQYPAMSPMPYPQNMSHGGYYPPQYHSPPYEHQPQRPPMSARGSSQMRMAPLVTQGNEEPSKYPSARYAPPPTAAELQQQQRIAYRPNPKLLHDRQYQEQEESEGESSSEEYESDEHDAQEEERRTRADRALMPPPILRRDKSQQRPPLSHAKTAPAVERLEHRESRRKSIVVSDPLPERERSRPARRQSVHRPSHRQTQSDYTTPQARVEVHRTGSNRGQSYQAYERAQMEYAKARQAEALEQQYREERKREKRASRVIVDQKPRSRHIPGQFDDDEEEEEDDYEEPAPQVLRARNTRRKTDASEERTRKERAPEPKNKRAVAAAEEYIMSTRGSRDPYADSINKAAKRQSQYGDPSESGSSHSNGASQSNRTTMTSNTTNGLRLQFDSTQAINLQLSGDMEGRTLQLVPGDNGMTDLVIGGNSRNEGTVYHSQKGSVRGNNGNRRSLVEGGSRRRDAEDYSERSSRNGRSRREREEIHQDYEDAGPALRRVRKTTTYN